MKSEIPPRTITAPSAIPIAAPPDSELPPDVGLVLVSACGVVVVVDGVVGPDGSDGENGLLPPLPSPIVLLADAASPAAGDASRDAAEDANSSAPTVSQLQQRHLIGATQPPLRLNASTQPAYRSDASGCSIAGVSGAVRYGSSFS